MAGPYKPYMYICGTYHTIPYHVPANFANNPLYKFVFTLLYFTLLSLVLGYIPKNNPQSKSWSELSWVELSWVLAFWVEFCHSLYTPGKFLGTSLIHPKQEQKQSKAKQVSMLKCSCFVYSFQDGAHIHVLSQSLKN
jgi:hypothetical protein